MAYVSQEMKAKIAPVIKDLLQEYELSGSLSISNHMKLVLTIKSGCLDFFRNEEDRKHGYLQVNHYHIDGYSDEVKKFLTKAIDALKGPDYYDLSDAQTDYFNCSHYISINVGKWNKQYVFKDKREVEYEKLSNQVDKKTNVVLPTKKMKI